MTTGPNEKLELAIRDAVLAGLASLELDGYPVTCSPERMSTLMDHYLQTINLTPKN
jgi:hypothetical protein